MMARLTIRAAICLSLLYCLALPQTDSAHAENPLQAKGNALANLEPRQLALANAARWLINPAQQEAVLSGKFYQPCPLPALTAEAKGKMSLPEVVRLWGVLESGWPNKPALQPAVDRFRKSKAGKADRYLGPQAVYALCARAAYRCELLDERQYKSVLKDVWRTAEGAKEATQSKGPWLTDERAEPEWFANVLWRVLLYRCVKEAGLVDASVPLQNDIEELLARFSTLRKRFSAEKDATYSDITELLHCNLFGFAALSQAMALGDGAITKSDMDAAKVAMESAQTAMTAAGKIQWFARGCGAYRGARGMIGQLVSGLAQPSTTSNPETFDDWLFGIQVHCQRIDGGFNGSLEVCSQLGLAEEPVEFTPDYAALVETALTVPLLAGGLFTERRSDLSDGKPEECAKWIEALLAEHKANAPRALATTFERRVAVAILDGCDYLESIQGDDGNFAKSGTTRLGVPGLCLMALLHGGRPRDAASIKRGLEFFDKQDWGFKEGLFQGYTYDAAVLLMVLQLYYEPELEQGGMLEADTPKKYADARQAMWKLLPANHRERVNSLVEVIGAHRTGPDSGYTYRKYPDRELASRGDNSNSQYAMLGYKAAALLGAEFEDEVFIDEAKRLLDQYMPVAFLPEVPGLRREEMADPEDPKKKTATASPVKPSSWTYSCSKAAGCVPQMTAAGISSLMISLDELKLRGKLDKKIEVQLEDCITSSLATLQLKYYDEQGRNELWGDLSESQAGWGLYYNLYSVERGCRMAGVRFLGGTIDWHTIGSEILVRLQRKDGSWTGARYNGPTTATVTSNNASDAIDSCLAILFLKAAALPVITEAKGKKKPGGD